MLSIAALVTDVAIDKFAVVEADKNGAQALAAAHVLSLARGFLLSLVLVAGAPMVAALFGVPQFEASFAYAGLVPFVSSFAHLGIKQVQRHYDYAPETWSLLLSNLVSICVLLVAVWLLRDHRAIVVSFLIEAIAYVFASHWLARTRYHLKPSRALMRKALVFGIPLMLNGIGLALIAQFDRALVGHWFGVDVLASYSVLLSISVVPISLILRVFGTLSLSFILSKISNGRLASDQYAALVFLFSILAVVYSLFVALTLDWATPLIFGRTFGVSLGIHLLLTIIVFLRLQRGGAPTSLFLATGRTRELALLNLSAAFGLLLGYALLFWSLRLETLLFGLAIGDIASLLLFFFVSSTIVSLNRSCLIIDFGAAVVVLAIVLGMLAYHPDVTVVARMTLFAIGIVAVALQVAIGLGNHRAVL
jgi:O-antigen/teichoic acid export membrane protein